MRRLSDILDDPRVYRLWQAPFARGKVRPMLTGDALQGVKRVLEIGCGPGIHAGLFTETEYVGVDLDPRYVAYAERHCAGRFLQADATAFDPRPLGQFDLVFACSVLHHLDNDGVRAVLERIDACLDVSGKACIIDLVLPSADGIARWLARHDRGAYARTPEQWEEALAQTLSPLRMETYDLSFLGIALWHLLYFEGRKRT